MSALGILARVVLLTAALVPSRQSQASAAVDCPDPAPIVAGIQQLVSGGAPGPLFATAPGVVAIVSGDEDTPVPSTFVVVAACGLGRVIAMGHDGLITNSDIGRLDNRRFARQAFEWLDASHRHALGVTSGHGETMRDEWSDSLRATLALDGWTGAPVPDRIDSASLAPYSAVLVSNAAGLPPTAAERAALLAFVEAGGGVFLQGLGWGWAAYHPGMVLDEYPMNQIGAMFGIRWIEGSIDDPTDLYDGVTRFHHFYPNLPPPTTTAEALEIVRSTNAAHVSDLATALESDADMRRLYVRAHQFLPAAERAFALEAPQRAELYGAFRQALDASGPWFHRTAPYDRTLYPAMGWLRERGARTLADAAPLTSARTAEIATTLGLTGTYAHLWTSHHLLVLDNLGLDAVQLAYFDSLMGAIPAAVHDLRSIMVRDLLGITSPAVSLDGVGAGGVNVFPAPIGAGSEDQFPADSPEPGWADLFCVVTAHEVNHVVDAWLASTRPEFRAFRDSCIARAGADPMHYLRSMGNWGGFVDSPQEFFAGTSGQWFTDSWLTVRLGLARFAGGCPWPIDQAYLFLTAYSNGEPFTRFYHNDTQGHFTVERAPVGRDGQGRITDLWHQGHHVHFELGADGHVAGVTLGTSDVSGAEQTAEPRLVVFPNPSRGGVWVRLTGMPPAGARAALYDLAGRLVTALAAPAAEGTWQIARTDRDGRRLAPGVYLVRVRQAGRTLEKRLVLLE